MSYACLLLALDPFISTNGKLSVATLRRYWLTVCWQTGEWVRGISPTYTEPGCDMTFPRISWQANGVVSNLGYTHA